LYCYSPLFRRSYEWLEEVIECLEEVNFNCHNSLVGSGYGVSREEVIECLEEVIECLEVVMEFEVVIECFDEIIVWLEWTVTTVTSTAIIPSLEVVIENNV